MANLQEYGRCVGHVQIADSPRRGSQGREIHYRVPSPLEELGYDGYAGLEYNPTTGTTEESFGWLPKSCGQGRGGPGSEPVKEAEGEQGEESSFRRVYRPESLSLTLSIRPPLLPDLIGGLSRLPDPSPGPRPPPCL